MNPIKHELRRAIDPAYERLVRVYYGAEPMRDIPVGTTVFGHEQPQIEIQLAIMMFEIGAEQRKRYRADLELCEIAWALMEKDRYTAQGFRTEDCLGYQLGVRSPMTGDVFSVQYEDERFFMVAMVGFVKITKEQADKLLSTPSHSRWKLQHEIEKENRNE